MKNFKIFLFIGVLVCGFILLCYLSIGSKQTNVEISEHGQAVIDNIMDNYAHWWGSEKAPNDRITLANDRITSSSSGTCFMQVRQVKLKNPYQRASVAEIKYLYFRITENMFSIIDEDEYNSRASKKQFTSWDYNYSKEQGRQIISNLYVAVFESKQKSNYEDWTEHVIFN